MCTLSPTPRKPKPVFSRVVDPDRVESASFCRIRIGIGIWGLLIRIQSIRIGIIAMHMKYGKAVTKSKKK
jgi:hypothetical protein